jgi:hypothetical protein
MNRDVPPDFKKLMRYLSGRYRYPVIRYNHPIEDEVTSINISDCAGIRLTISRGDNWGWEAEGEILDGEVQFEAESKIELVRKLDEHFREVRALKGFLGIEKLM